MGAGGAAAGTCRTVCCQRAPATDPAEHQLISSSAPFSAPSAQLVWPCHAAGRDKRRGRQGPRWCAACPRPCCSWGRQCGARQLAPWGGPRCCRRRRRERPVPQPKDERDGVAQGENGTTAPAIASGRTERGPLRALACPCGVVAGTRPTRRRSVSATCMHCGVLLAVLACTPCYGCIYLQAHNFKLFLYSSGWPNCGRHTRRRFLRPGRAAPGKF